MVLNREQGRIRQEYLCEEVFWKIELEWEYGQAMRAKNLHIILQAKGKLRKSFEQGHCMSELFLKKILLVGAGRLHLLFSSKMNYVNLTECGATGMVGKEGAKWGRGLIDTIDGSLHGVGEEAKERGLLEKMQGLPQVSRVAE